MTTTIYTGTCTSSRKAKSWLTQHNIPFVEKNIDKNPLTLEEIKHILYMTEMGTDEIISTRSMVFQDLQIDLDTISLKQLMELISANPKMLRRPIRSEEHTSELQSRFDLVCRLLLEKKNT